jgi:hypothetical protein
MNFDSSSTEPAEPGQALRGMASITGRVPAIHCHHSEQCLS